MTRVEFWDIIKGARGAAGADQEKLHDHLVQVLSKLQPAEILEFNLILTDAIYTANSWNVRGAANVIAGGCGDDAFMDFREWLVTKGQEIYENAISNPDSLADVVDINDTIFFEGLWTVVAEAYEVVVGSQLPHEHEMAIMSDPRRSTETGKRWGSEAELRQKYPRLYALVSTRK